MFETKCQRCSPEVLILQAIGLADKMWAAGGCVGGQAAAQAGGQAAGPTCTILALPSRQVSFDKFVKSRMGGWLRGPSPDFHTPKL